MAGDFNDLPQLLEAIHAGTVVGIRQATREVSSDAAGWAPVDTGFLKASNYYVTSDNSTYGNSVGRAQSIDAFRKVLPEIDPPGDDTTGIAAVAASYAAPVEYGTSKAGAQPFMHPAAEAMRGKLPGIMAKAIAAAIKAVVK